VTDGFSDHDSELIVIKNIGLILYYHNYDNLTRLMNNDIAKECTTQCNLGISKVGVMWVQNSSPKQRIGCSKLIIR
jgi:hypothetical protein